MPRSTDFNFRAGSLDEEDLRVLRFTGAETLSQCFVYDLDLATLEPTVDFEEIVGEPAHLEIHTPFGQRHVDGIIARWEEMGRGRDATYFSARLVPRVWTLSLIRQSRIFQKLTTQEILKKVFEAADIPANTVRWSLNGSYDPRGYCVQYRETDLDFICRLMEEEGMFFFFEHTEDGHVMVIGDSPDVHADLPEDATLRFREADSGMLGEEQIMQFRYARSLRTGAVTLKEFDFKKPALALLAKLESKDKEKILESYDYPGEYHMQGLGDRLARTRLEEERADTYLGVGETDCRRFEPGFKFEIEEHPREDLNTEYVITRVRHTGDQPHAGFGQGGGGSRNPVYRATFGCIPFVLPYRPPRVTPRPHIDGPQTAIVVGPKGEEIHCDDFGRVKVKFHWDRTDANDDSVSCWIRVSQGWGGAGWGMMFIPRIGQEVVVEFLEGDPDRPLITGRVYNAENPPPYELPGDKTKSTIKSQSSPGGNGSNEIRFEDAAGSEEVYIHAQKDMNEVVAHNKTVQVKSNLLEKVTVNRTRSVGGNETITVDGNRTETVKSNQQTTVGGSESVLINGNETIIIGGIRSENVGGSAVEAIGGNQITAVKGNQTVEVGAALVEVVGAARATVVKGDLEHKSGGATIQLVSGAKVVNAKGNLTEQAALIAETAAGGHKIKAGGDLTVTAANVKITASSSIKITCGGSSIEIKSGQIKIKSGGSMKVDASGTLTLKGSSIKNN